MTTLEDKTLWETSPDEELLGADIMKASTEEINNRTRLLDNDIKVLRLHQDTLCNTLDTWVGACIHAYLSGLVMDADLHSPYHYRYGT